MRKIPTLFVRDPADMSCVLPEYHPACDWVRAGEGVATRKYDGTCVALDQFGHWYARREVKPGQSDPMNFEELDADEVTGKRVGWVPIVQSSFAKFHAEALAEHPWSTPGTYELIGPKINGNPERAVRHELIRHADAQPLPAPRKFDWLAIWLGRADIEGIVWHHPDGRMAKIKGRDFGHRRADR